MNAQDRPVIIIDAHPSTDSHSTMAADAFAAAAKRAGRTIKRYRAYDLPRTEDVTRGEKNAAYAQIAQDFTDAHAICFASPVWWFGMTAALKDVLDAGLQARTHFKYVKKFGMGVPVGLMRKEIQVHTAFTSGSPNWLFWLGVVPNYLKKTIHKSFALCGVSRWNMKTYHLGGMGASMQKTTVQAWLKRIEQIQF